MNFKIWPILWTGDVINDVINIYLYNCSHNPIIHMHREFNDNIFARCLVIMNKANLRDLIAATGLVILLILDSNRRFFSPCDLEIWWMTSKYNRAPLLCYFKLFASCCSHWRIKTGVTVRKRQFGSNSTILRAVWPCNLMDDLEKQ